MIIYLQIDMQKCWKISEFSQTMNWFIRQQNFDAIFEIFNHSNLDDLLCQCCIMNCAFKRFKISEKRSASRNKNKNSASKKQHLLLSCEVWDSWHYEYILYVTLEVYYYIYLFITNINWASVLVCLKWQSLMLRNMICSLKYLIHQTITK